MKVSAKVKRSYVVKGVGTFQCESEWNGLSKLVELESRYVMIVRLPSGCATLLSNLGISDNLEFDVVQASPQITAKIEANEKAFQDDLANEKAFQADLAAAKKEALEDTVTYP